MQDFNYTGDVLQAANALEFLGESLVDRQNALPAEEVLGVAYICRLIKADLERATEAHEKH
jgi:hypothetical protein